MRSGGEKRGKILAEDDRQVLLDSETDGSVIEVQRSDISILEREDSEKRSTGGYLSFYSTVPKKKRKPEPEPHYLTGADSSVKASRMFATESSEEKPTAMDKLDTMFQDFMDKHPEIEKGLKGLMDKAIKDSSELDKLVAAAKQN